MRDAQPRAGGEAVADRVQRDRARATGSPGTSGTTRSCPSRCVRLSWRARHEQRGAAGQHLAQAHAHERQRAIADEREIGDWRGRAARAAHRAAASRSRASGRRRRAGRTAGRRSGRRRTRRRRRGRSVCEPTHLEHGALAGRRARARRPRVRCSRSSRACGRRPGRLGDPAARAAPRSARAAARSPAARRSAPAPRRCPLRMPLSQRS